MKMAMPTLTASTAVSSVRSVERSRSPAVTPRDAAMKPDTASATSMMRAHHQRDVAAATRPNTSRGTISRQPVWVCPRWCCMMRLSPIQPRMRTRTPEATAHTTAHASRTRGFR